MRAPPPACTHGFRFSPSFLILLPQNCSRAQTPDCKRAWSPGSDTVRTYEEEPRGHGRGGPCAACLVLSSAVTAPFPFQLTCHCTSGLLDSPPPYIKHDFFPCKIHHSKLTCLLRGETRGAQVAHAPHAPKAPLPARATGCVSPRLCAPSPSAGRSHGAWAVSWRWGCLRGQTAGAGGAGSESSWRSCGWGMSPGAAFCSIEFRDGRIHCFSPWPGSAFPALRNVRARLLGPR